jgi:Family of unknown function (DUF6510)
VERLDGNAMGGPLGELFAFEITAARGRCDNCGTIAAFGAAHVYAAPLAPGSVVRCSTCESVLAVVVDADGRIRVGMQGLTWLEVAR